MNLLKAFKKLKTSTKMLLIVITSVVLMCVVMTVAIKRDVKDIMSRDFESEMKSKNSLIIANMEEMKSRALNATKWFENSSRIRTALKNRNEAEALAFGKLAMDSMMLDYLVITDKNGNVFIRAHEPEKKGDSIANQLNIQKALKGEQNVGIEEGKVVKLSIRAGTPLRDEDGSIIGSISLGYVFSNNTFVDKQKSLLATDISVFFGDERVATTVEKDGKRAVGTKITDSKISDTVLKRGEIYSGPSLVSGMPYYASYIPIKDGNENIIGVLAFGKNMSIIDAMTNKLVRDIVIILLILSAILCFVLILFQNKSIIKPLMMVISRLKTGSEFITSASSELSSASQQLAEGSTEQAASIEETSATMEETASMVKQNAENTMQAYALSEQAAEVAGIGLDKMNEMNNAMQEIKKSSGEIAKIIKVIDEIAFQTNILALNAAVEAARAGEVGAGFAVVAEEVRNLAQRSANAAKDTAEKIERNIDLSVKGVEISENVNEYLSQIGDGVNKVNMIMAEIAGASDEQSKGIDQIAKAISQMEQVTQQNAAVAQESSASSEELQAQAEEITSIVRELNVFVNGANNEEETHQKSGHNKKSTHNKAIPRHIAQSLETIHQHGTKSKEKIMAGKHSTPADVIPLENGDEF